MAQFSKGTKVKQIVAPVEGEVTGFTVDQESGDVQVLVEWTDSDGVQHGRYFKETDLETA